MAVCHLSSVRAMRVLPSVENTIKDIRSCGLEIQTEIHREVTPCFRFRFDNMVNTLPVWTNLINLCAKWSTK